MDGSNVTKEDLHVLISTKTNYLNECIIIPSSEKVSTIKSVNYPGFYPVGLTENWNFIGNNTNYALVTIEDVHLAGILFVVFDSNICCTLKLFVNLYIFLFYF